MTDTTRLFLLVLDRNQPTAQARLENWLGKDMLATLLAHINDAQRYVVIATLPPKKGGKLVHTAEVMPTLSEAMNRASFHLRLAHELLAVPMTPVHVDIRFVLDPEERDQVNKAIDDTEADLLRSALAGGQG